MQLAIIGIVSLLILSAKWKDLMVDFLDESHAPLIGINTTFLKVLFFTLLSASTVAALQTVGAFLVIRHGRHPRRNRLSPDRTVSRG